MNCKVEILRCLARCGGMLVPEPTLLNEVRLFSAPPPMATEFFSSLHELEASRLVVSVKPELGGPIKWGITDAGRAKLAEY